MISCVALGTLLTFSETWFFTYTVGTLSLKNENIIHVDSVYILAIAHKCTNYLTHYALNNWVIGISNTLYIL